MQKVFALCFLLGLCSLPSYTLAESLNDVIRAAISKHPDIALAQTNTSLAHNDQRRIQGMLDPTLSLNLSSSDETTPTTSPFATNQTQVSQLSGNIVKPWEDGSSLSANLSYNRTKLNYPASVPTTFQSSVNPVYKHQIDLTYRYPLLRGHNNPSYHEQLQISAQNEQASRWRVQQLKEQLAEQATALYFQLAADYLSVNLAKDTVNRAKKLLTYQKKREQFGLIEKAERLQAEALLASRQMAYANAIATRKKSLTSLNRLMLRSGSSPISTKIESIRAKDHRSLDINQLLQKAEEQRAIFQALDADEQANQASSQIALDQSDTQLDVIAQVGSRALSGSAGKTLGQGFTLNDRFISIGLEVHDSLGGNVAKANIQKVELQRERIILQRTQAIENIKSTLSSAITNYENAKMLMRSSMLQEQAEQRKFNAEIKRYREGRSNTATIVQFEGDLRIAELQAALQGIQMQLASKQIHLATGDVLKQVETP